MGKKGSNPPPPGKENKPSPPPPPPAKRGQNGAACGQSAASYHILPCPFCGYQPGQSVEDAIPSRSGRWYVIECDNYDCLEVAVRETSMGDAIKSWNTRHTAGLKSLVELSGMTEVSVQTLNNWFKDKPALFEIVLAGAVVKKGENNVERIEKFFNDLREDCTDSEIAAGLGNGDIDIPEWMAISEDTDHLKAWDQENGGSAQMGFVTVWYSDDGQ